MCYSEETISFLILNGKALSLAKQLYNNQESSELLIKFCQGKISLT